MAIVTFYRGDPKNAPKPTMPAHLGANAIITCGGRLLLERRRDSDTWGLIGGGVKKSETKSCKPTATPAELPPFRMAVCGEW